MSRQEDTETECPVAHSWKGRRSRDENGEPAFLTVDPLGMIHDCNKMAEALFRSRRSGLIWRNISSLLPELAGVELMPSGRINQRLSFLSHIGRRFRAVARDGGAFSSEIYLNLLDGPYASRLQLIVRPADVVSPHLEPSPVAAVV